MNKTFTEEPKGSFFIAVERSGEFLPLSEIDGIFAKRGLFSLAQMTEIYYAWEERVSVFLDQLSTRIDDEELKAEEFFEALESSLKEVKNFIPPEFVRTRKKIKVFEDSIKTYRKWDDENRRYDLRELLKRIREALREDSEETMFLVLSPTQREYYGDDTQFGSIAPIKFKEIAGDIEEAYKCLGAGRTTACVFHCMRMLEYGVHKLARHFGVALQVDVTDGKTGKLTGDKRDQEWNTLCQQILREIKHLPAPTPTEQEEKLKFEDLAIHISNVRAERNAVMHARYATTKRFTAKKAENVLEETKSFISELALLLP
jgi:hypothetical protein